MTVKPLFKGKKIIDRFAGKGGWTFIELPEIQQPKNGKFGMIRVKGSVDDCDIYAIHLMPRGNGILMLPLNLYIRKQIKKRKGDEVYLELYEDNDEVPIPKEFMECLEAEPEALVYFNTLSGSIKRNIIQYIYQATKAETRAKRIVMFMNRLVRKDIHNLNIK
jgi:hypothetical protein